MGPRFPALPIPKSSLTTRICQSFPDVNTNWRGGMVFQLATALRTAFRLTGFESSLILRTSGPTPEYRHLPPNSWAFAVKDWVLSDGRLKRLEIAAHAQARTTRKI